MRLFVAIELSAAAKTHLGTLQRRLRASCPDVRWIPEEQLHLTVKFLGEVPDDRAAEVADVVTRTAGEFSPFGMTLQSAGCFPPRGGVRIVWAGSHEPSGALVRCAAALDGALEKLGFPRESKPFSPHITIGRVREDRSAGRIRQAVAACSFSPHGEWVSWLSLMSSVLSPQGPTYSPVCRASFGPGKERS
jgi:2'-5' RNA ligase